MNVADQIRLFLEPRSVALIGVPRRTGRASFNMLENLLDLRFQGQIYPVNPNAESILGVKSYPDIKTLPMGIELSVIMVPRYKVPDVVRDCVEKNIKALIIISEGFAEAGEEGKELQSRIVRIAKHGEERILGPNSLGVVNNFHNFSSTFLPMPRGREPVALICQSGGLLEGFSDLIPGKSIDLGNMSDIEFSDVLEYLEDDPDIKVIVLHIEGIKDGKRFTEITSRVNKKKPILALKTGKSEQAIRAMASHSGSLAGSDKIYETAFKKAGLIRVNDVDEASDITKAFLNLPPMKGDRIAIVTPTGAGAVMIIDALDKQNLKLAKLSEESVDRLKNLFPAWSRPSNPVDIMAAGMAHGYKNAYKTSLEALLEDKNVDAILCIAGTPTLKTIKGVTDGRSKPVTTWVLGRWEESLLSKIKETNYKVAYPTPERAVRAIGALRYYSNFYKHKGFD